MSSLRFAQCSFSVVLIFAVAAQVLPQQGQGSPSGLAGPAGNEMKAYTVRIGGSDTSFDMVPVPGGNFLIGSPPEERWRKVDEGPQRKVRISPFWIGRCEVTWNEFELWSMDLEKKQRQTGKATPNDRDREADAVTRPTKPYGDMSFGMGRDGYPAICMTQKAARIYCEWLSARTGHFYRLPTEAEWEYACRAGTTEMFYFGKDKKELERHAWFGANSDGRYHKVGTKAPNPWGIHDIHGNVAEWTRDQYSPKRYELLPAEGAATDPWAKPKTVFPRVVRGGSWEDSPGKLRAAARRGSHEDWKIRDPQLPQSEWWHTDAPFVGFRVVRPLHPPKGWKAPKKNSAGVPEGKK